MAVTFTRKDGRQVTLLNPAEKGKKFVKELQIGCHHTNQMERKLDKDGNLQPLTKEERSYRAGYLDSRKDSANCYKANQKKKKKNTRSKNKRV